MLGEPEYPSLAPRGKQLLATLQCRASWWGRGEWGPPATAAFPDLVGLVSELYMYQSQGKGIVT